MLDPIAISIIITINSLIGFACAVLGIYKKQELKGHNIEKQGENNEISEIEEPLAKKLRDHDSKAYKVILNPDRTVNKKINVTFIFGETKKEKREALLSLIKKRLKLEDLSIEELSEVEKSVDKLKNRVSTISNQKSKTLQNKGNN